LTISEYLEAALVTTGITLALLVLLLRGSRVVWSLLTGLEVAGLLISPFETKPWWGLALGLVGLALLLAPASRHFVWRPRPLPVGRRIKQAEVTEGARRAEQTTWDPGGDLDQDRPAGWYVDPDSPDRMRYWSARDEEWMGTAKTPRKIRRVWDAQTANASSH
jgi:hypothetical protein